MKNVHINAKTFSITIGIQKLILNALGSISIFSLEIWLTVIEDIICSIPVTRYNIELDNPYKKWNLVEYAVDTIENMIEDGPIPKNPKEKSKIITVTKSAEIFRNMDAKATTIKPIFGVI